MRLFVALAPSAEVIRRIEAEIRRLRGVSPDARWAATDALHVTLAFLGEVEFSRAPEIAASIRRAAAYFPRFSLTARGSGTFGGKKSPRVLWLGLTGDIEPLSTLQSAVERELVPLGFAPEALPFTPHITLARTRAERGDAGLVTCAQELATADLGTFEVREMVLYRSQLSAEGARYTVLQSFPLPGVP